MSEAKEGLLVDIGVEQPAVLRETQFAVGDRLTLQVVNVGGRIEVQTVNREDIPVYWGFRVRRKNDLLGKLQVTASSI